MLRGSERCLVATVVLVCLFGASEAKAELAFGTPVKLPSPINTDDTADWTPSVSADGLTIYWVRGVSGVGDIWSATRASTSEPWGDPTRLSESVNTEGYEGFPSISSDGLSLYFSRSEIGYDGTARDSDIFVASRASVSDEWGPAVSLGPTVNDPLRYDAGPHISSDDLSLYFHSNREFGPGWAQIMVSTRPTKEDPWAEPVNLGLPINRSNDSNWTPSITSDGLSLLYAHMPIDNVPIYDIVVSTRESIADSWGDPKSINPQLGLTGSGFPGSVALDGSMFYYSVPVGDEDLDIWQVDIVPEPSTFLLAALGIMALLPHARPRRR